MGARPSSFKRGGGYLNNVTATVVGYSFLVGEPAEMKKGDRKGEMFTPLSLVPEFQEEGASDVKTQRLLIGEATDYGDVEDDGLTLLTPEGQAIPASSEAGIFLASLCDSPEFPEDRFEETDERINLEPMIGTRLVLVQEVNAEKTTRQGKQKGKNGKEYDRKDLKVKEVLSVAAIKGVKASAKSSGKGAKPVEVDIDKVADAVVPGLVEKAGGSLARKQLGARLQVTKTKFPAYAGVWVAVSARVQSEEYLADAAERGIIGYDPKKQVLSLAA